MDRSIRNLSSFETMARQVVERTVRRLKGRFVLMDATAGNGHDTLFLAGLASEHGGETLAFDIQPQALACTESRLREAVLSARLVCAGHEDLDEYVREAAPLAAVMFNLGFLPGSDKAVTTRPESTLAALNAAAERLMPNGVISVHAYTGHPGGKEEAEAVGAWARSRAREVWRVQEIFEANKPEGAEYLWLMEKVNPAMNLAMNLVADMVARL